eukprot:5740677-Prymnesium_polylepis.1
MGIRDPGAPMRQLGIDDVLGSILRACWQPCSADSGSGRFLLHVPTHCTESNVYVHESARGARDVGRSMSGVAGLVSRASVPAP